MIVDDDPYFRTALERTLSRQNDWTVESVETSREAIERWRAGEYDVLLVDKNLKGESGVTLVDEIRKQDPFVGIVMITGYGSLENAKEMLHIGIDGYVEKPIEDFAELALSLRVVIDRSRRRRKAAEKLVLFRGSRPAPRMNDREENRSLMIVSPTSGERAWIARQFDETYRICYAGSSAEAVKVIQQSPQDIVLVDAAVRKPDVFEFVRLIGKRDEGTDIVIVSHVLSMEEIKRFIELKVTALIERPLSEEVFRKKIAHVLSKGAQRKMADSS